MAIKWRVKPESFTDQVEIARVEKTIELLKLDEVTAIDSYSMSPDGPILSSIVLLSETYLAEVTTSGKHLMFDMGSARGLINYRVTYGEHAPQIDASASGVEGSTTAAKPTKFVSVTLRHTDQLTTVMWFFGDDVDSWLNFIFEAYPPKFALG